ncbi:MAG: hypothetical protein QNJ41_12205 [Xenococcaceae cyanobacterium MO_188.B32]|nr:hypothetical protein [Xenococcaceae cyanobacterium MO_188.B32]
MNTKLIDSLVQIINSLTTEERINLEQKLHVQNLSTEIDQSNLQEEPFVGMWKEREDMEDSSQWVRQIRLSIVAIFNNISYQIPTTYQSNFCLIKNI